MRTVKYFLSVALLLSCGCNPAAFPAWLIGAGARVGEKNEDHSKNYTFNVQDKETAKDIAEEIVRADARTERYEVGADMVTDNLRNLIIGSVALIVLLAFLIIYYNKRFRSIAEYYRHVIHDAKDSVDDAIEMHVGDEEIKKRLKAQMRVSQEKKTREELRCLK